jgi:hypothetical protein
VDEQELTLDLRAAIKQYLKDFLVIDVDSSCERDYGSEYKSIEVKLFLEGEYVTGCSTSI